jgi:hypothetical protein
MPDELGCDQHAHALLRYSTECEVNQKLNCANHSTSVGDWTHSTLILSHYRYFKGWAGNTQALRGTKMNPHCNMTISAHGYLAAHGVPADPRVVLDHLAAYLPLQEAR